MPTGPVLENFHRKILCINGDEQKTYRFEELQSKDSLERHISRGLNDYRRQGRSATEIDEGAAALEARSAPFKSVADAREARFATFKERFGSVSFERRLVRLLRLGLSRSSALKFGVLTVFLVLKLGLDYSGVLLTGWMIEAMQSRDKAMFIRNTGIFLLRACIGTAVDSLSSFTQRTLALELSSDLVHALQEKAMAGSMYYKLKNVDGRIDDIDSRLVDDANSFAETMSSMSDRLLWPVLQVLLYASAVTNMIRGRRAAILWGYMLFAAVAIKVLMPDFKSISAEISDLEGKYKRVHNNVRGASESIAFFGGGARERAVVRSRIFTLIDVHVRREWINCWWGPLRHIILSEAPDKLQETIRFSYLEEEYSNDGSTQVDAAGAAIEKDIIFFWEASDKVLSCVRQLIGFADTINSFSGIVARVSELAEVIEELEEEERGLGDAGPAVAPGSIVFQEVDLLTPTARCLGTKISATVSDGESLMVTGPNAAGKTSLNRVISGLWSPGGGALLVDRSDVAVVPQRAYSCIGSLQDQITYPVIIAPEQRTPELVQKMRQLLSIVGIEYLADREQQEQLTKAKAAADQIAKLAQTQLQRQYLRSPDSPAESEEAKQLESLRKEEAAAREAAAAAEAAGGGWDQTRVWEDSLSLGEQQRLAMARLFYRQPRFGVLDECTSAVSVDVETKLYQAAAEKGITTVTISQRLALEQFHSQQLRLGLPSASGWELRQIGRGVSRPSRAGNAPLGVAGPPTTIASAASFTQRLAADRVDDYRKYAQGSR